MIKKKIKKNSSLAVYLYLRAKCYINKFYYKNNLEKYLKNRFIRNVGYIPNITNPKSYNEKLQWLKLNWYNPLAAKCADKYTVREYVKDKGLENILNNLYGVFESTSEINIDKFPEKFVLKTTHGSGMNIICPDKKNFDWRNAKKQLERWLKLNYYYLGGEWVYKDLKPRIICEEFIETIDNKPPKDYKIFCFNGKPHLLFVASDRGISTKFDFYTCDWKRIPLKQHYPNSNTELEKPRALEEMLSIAEKLSEGFPHVRVDFYYEQERVIFGEMTFFHFGGTQPFEPVEYDYILGELLDLQEIKS